jgi:hypothetical protein
MSVLDTILSSQNGAAVQQLAAQFGLGPDQATAALSALVPAIAAGVHQQTQSSDGLAGLVAAITGGQHQQYVNDPSTLSGAGTVQDGNAILGHVFGSKDVSRQVAAQAATHTGLDPELLKKMLPMAAALVMGALANHATAASRGGSAAGGIGASLGVPPALGGIGGSLVGALTSTLTRAAGNAAGKGMVDLLGTLLRR